MTLVCLDPATPIKRATWARLEDMIQSNARPAKRKSYLLFSPNVGDKVIFA